MKVDFERNFWKDRYLKIKNAKEGQKEPAVKQEGVEVEVLDLDITPDDKNIVVLTQVIVVDTKEKDVRKDFEIIRILIDDTLQDNIQVDFIYNKKDIEQIY